MAMERVHIAVPEKTAELVEEIKEKMRKDTGFNVSNGTVVAKAVAEFHSKEMGA